MDVKLYKINPWPEWTQEHEDLYKEGIKKKTWDDDESSRLESTKAERVKIKKTVRRETRSDNWQLINTDIDFSGLIETPIIFNTYIDLFKSKQSDYPMNDQRLPIMSKRMSAIILSTGIRCAVYPVKIVERYPIKYLSDEEKYERMKEMAREVNVEYDVVHILDKIDIADVEKSDYINNELEITGKTDNLPPFFKISWKLSWAMVATQEGKDLLEDAGIRGVEFEELQLV